MDNEKKNNLEIICTTLSAANDDIKVLTAVLKDLKGICITNPQMVEKIVQAVEDCIIERTKNTIHKLSKAIG